jgi:predicted Fe-Mo cluster-binding NifX family protein
MALAVATREAAEAATTNSSSRKNLMEPNTNTKITTGNFANSKIAAITDDGKTISQHFGRAAYYLVATIENGQILDRELRHKLGHTHFVNQPHAEEQPGQPHGLDAASHERHLQMAEAISDCQTLLCRGMGMGAYESMKARGIRPVVTDIVSIDEAVMACIEGSIVDQVERLH